MLQIQNWQVRRADGNQWIPAKVPGTVLSSYIDAGLIPDPLYDDNWNSVRLQDEFFTSNFEYRGSFRISPNPSEPRVYLNFEALNWKADVFLNGAKLPNALPHRQHSVEGAFTRAKFDISGMVQPDSDNILEVLIFCNDTPGTLTFQGLAEGPGPNGGLLGADNPTLHASVGWDWIPTIPGRNIGLYGDVYVTQEGAVQIIDPWVETKLNLTETTSATSAEPLFVLPRDEKRTFNSGESAVYDLGATISVGCVQFTWGWDENGAAAADLAARFPSGFTLETSLDGVTWRNADAFPGGPVDVQFWGERLADPNPGTAEYEGHATGDSVRGGTAIVPMDLSMFNMGLVDMPIFSPQQARYLRFTVTKLRELNGKPVDTRIADLRVYVESSQQVEQSTAHEYSLDASSAEIILRTELQSLTDFTGDLHIEIKFASDIVSYFTLPISLTANTIQPLEHRFTLPNPKLWWPNTYGEQPLYTLNLSVGATAVTQKFGVRQFTYPIDGGILTLYCNGTRIVCKGGNWGMDDALKRDTPEIYDHKVHLHAHANFTMIRNWIGMTNNKAFYEACDKYGILIWDDFWLANPVDGPNPNDYSLFLENAEDKIRSVRSHAALALYCGRNEGDPPEPLFSELPALVERLDGSRTYFQNSASAPVGSGGGYQLAYPGGNGGIKQYFNDVTSPVLRSERGIPNVPNLETLRKFLRPEHLWPINEVWALHDWTYHMNGPANSYMAALKTYLGGDFEIPADNVQGQKPDPADPVFAAYKAAVYEMDEDAGAAWTLEQFSKAAQMINYDNHRGLFDALSTRRSNGLLMWMSQSSWPSFMWQTYDYFLDCNGGYYGCKAGCAPVKAIFDPRTEEIIVSNATADTLCNVEVHCSLYNLHGKEIYSKEFELADILPDTYGLFVAKADFTQSDTDICFLRLSVHASILTIKHLNGKIRHETCYCYDDGTEQTYWHNRAEYQNYRAIGALPDPKLELSVTKPHGKSRLKVTNVGDTVSMITRAQIVDDDGNDLLPVFWLSNYVTLMPGESFWAFCNYTNPSNKQLHFKVNSSSVPIL